MAHATTLIDFTTEPSAQRSSGTMQMAERSKRTLPSKAPLLPHKPVVLIVEDDEEFRNSPVRMLAECDLAAIGATSSINALEVLQHSSVDIVVSDQFTSGMDGVSLLSIVRRRGPRVQRIRFTADGSPDIMLDAINRAGVHKL
jgi:CheY-like chemotaxis protein